MILRKVFTQVASGICLLGVAHGHKFCDKPPDVITNSPDDLIIRANCENFKISDVSCPIILLQKDGFLTAQPQTCIYRPPGAQLVSISASQNSSSEKLAVFVPEKYNAKDVQHALIMVAGKLSNAGLYWERLRNVSEGLAGTRFKSRNAIPVAPILFSDRFTPDLHGEDELSWASPGAWIAGRTANYPPTTNLTSIDALEALVDEFSNTEKYPALTNITFIGQSAGGQLVQRYAAAAKDPPPNIHIRYVQNNPATCSYFTAQRPSVKGASIPSIDSCKRYDHWPYGFTGFKGTSTGRKTPRQYFEQYISRDVVATVGYLDTNPCSGDQGCRAVMQGGRKRRNRNLVWYRYVHELARTGEDLRGFPGRFEGLPDWSGGRVRLRLALARNAGHEFQDIFQTEVGLSALFDDGNVMEGFRPGRRGRVG
ncbi:transmembrane protein [Pochonia chlamydosporia 170]|uniref:Transmembrane protein n=1 Tax=Pochonia chlamydosporia 170 TaxID=1380566 RepID=A0A179F6D5_METCM|nr:transmembrane protein [Pochonia chlamydosporia 170]OAQ61005.1 transmembrane protein [Pochonia chlamydosporia 170]